MKFENTEVFNFEGALRGMRNPKESWKKSDSYRLSESNPEYKARGGYFIGPNDMKLAQTLIKGGSEHRKFMQQIFVSVDITAPLYWWAEADTYRVAITKNSTSKMHKLASTPITIDCFEIDDYDPLAIEEIDTGVNLSGEQLIINFCEDLRQKYLETKDKKYWKELIRWLPEGWLQKRTMTMNYENLYAMYHQRKDHKLNEWSGKDNQYYPNFIAWLKTLPYSKELIWGIQENVIDN